MNSTTKNHAAKLFERIIKLTNEGKTVTFTDTFGDGELTVIVGDDHFHIEVESTEDFIEYCYNNLGKETNET